MMKIISINAGSSSLKFSLFEMTDESVLVSGQFERIGSDGSGYTFKYNGQKITEEIPLKDHTDAVTILLDKLIALEIIHSLDEIKGVGHRIVHGGSKYSESVFVTNQVIDDIDAFKEFAPLHNPAHLLGIKAFKEALPDVPMVVVFDTAFHQTMDEVTYLYPVPYHWCGDYGVRKYGAHGTSHRYIAETVKDMLGREDFKLISCHIGNGGSITAIQNMKCVDTSMGFTPLAGIMMGTRSGDVDPSIIPYVMEKEGKNASEVIEDLNKNSGVFGMSEYSHDLRDIVSQCEEGNEKAIRAKDKYVRRIVDYIAQYYALLEGCDMIVFTAGVGENNSAIRKEVCEKLAVFGVEIDPEKNLVRGETCKISTEASKIAVWVIPTNEELMIARDTLNLIKNR
ncbi:MAG: acetate kinase [Bacilli bacterium]|nr:acetate kinase [Bacilli bacterium]